MDAFPVLPHKVNAEALVLVAPALDILIHAEPANKVFVQGLVAGGLNTIVALILGTLLALGYSRIRVKSGSLKQE
jgi:energy-coupling factor transport system substrate-specific component